MAVDPNARLIITAQDATRAAWDAALRTANAGSTKIAGALKGAIGGLGVAGAAIALKKVIQDSVEFADQIGKGAERTQLAAESFSTLAGAAAKADVPVKTLTAGLNTMQVNLANTTVAGGKLSDELKDLGLDITKLKSLTADQQFLKLADAIRQVEDPAEKARLRLAVFGASADEFAGLIEKGADGIQKLRNQSRALSEEQLENISKLDESFKDIASAAKDFGLSITAAIAEPLAAIINFGTEVANLGRNLTGGLSEIEEIETKLRILKEAQGSIPIVFDFLGKIDDGNFVMGPKAIETEIKRLQEKLDAARKGNPSAAAAPPPINEMIEIRSPGLEGLPGLLGGPDPDVREEIDRQARLRDLALEGEVERNRVLDNELGRGVQGERRDRMLEEEREYFENLQGIVEENAERSVEASDRVLEEYSDRLTEKIMERNAVLEGAMEEFGRSIQSSLSDVFFNAGKGADNFASSVLNAFKRILADAAAQKVVQLLSGLGGGAKTGAGAGGGKGGIIGSILGAFIGGARAEGGPVSSGLGYLVGERGPELFLPKQNGTIVPNSSLGGAMPMSIDARVYVDARGATKDGAAELMSQLPRILDQRDRRLRDSIREDINRGRFGLKA